MNETSVGGAGAPDPARLLVESVRRYADAADIAGELPPLDGVTATEAAVVATALLAAADIEVFELGMWQAWGTR